MTCGDTGVATLLMEVEMPSADCFEDFEVGCSVGPGLVVSAWTI